MDTYSKIKILNRLKLFNTARSVLGWLRSFDPQKKRFFNQFISKNDLVFDIGANVGQMTDIFLHLGAKVVCVEPQTRCFNFLQAKYKFNQNVLLINKALDSKNDLKQEIYLSEANALSSLSSDHIKSIQMSGRYSEYQWGKTETVLTTTLDELIKKFGKPIFCKIDVEGYELNVLNGLTQTIRYLSFEIAPESIEQSKACINQLIRIGNIQLNFSSDTTNMKLPNWLKPANFLKWLSSEPKEGMFGDIYVHFI